jgi:hypothetical protein
MRLLHYPYVRLSPRVACRTSYTRRLRAYCTRTLATCLSGPDIDQSISYVHSSPDQLMGGGGGDADPWLLRGRSEFSWPRKVSVEAQWRLLGNGLHIGVARHVLEHLLLRMPPQPLGGAGAGAGIGLVATAMAMMALAGPAEQRARRRPDHCTPATRRLSFSFSVSRW